ncbi:MAG TPA: hypothetical protein ENN89_05165, partial [Synergistetes bacterium]|nr:hypothetical protein [Synergistota bacterium]
MRKKFLFAGIAVSFAFIFLVSSANTAPWDEKYSWNVIETGVFGTDIRGKRIISGMFIDRERSSLITWDGGATPSFTLHNPGIHGWETNKSFDVGGVDFERTPWLAADVDGDGLDEILFFAEGSLLRLDLDQNISPVSYALFPKNTISAVSVQADEDTSRELVLAYHEPDKENLTDGPMPLWVGLWDFDESGCKFLWADEGSLG